MMPPAAKTFLTMDAKRKRVVHELLVRRAVHAWEQYAQTKRRGLNYVETVAGTRQKVDIGLPREAVEAADEPGVAGNIEARFLEPIVALQDQDWSPPEPVVYAYYAVYNYFRKYALSEDVDDWLIVNQALSGTTPLESCEETLIGILQEAETHGAS